MQKTTLALLILCVLSIQCGCGGSSDATPAENIVQERPVLFEKGPDGKMVPSSAMKPAPAK